MKRNRLVKYLLYAGLEKEEYHRIQDLYLAPNWMLLNLFALTGVVVTAAFFLMSLFSPSLAGSRYGYLGACLVALGIAMVNVKKGRHNLRLLSLLCGLFAMAAYLMAILNGTVGDPDQIAVTFIVSIVVVPVIFNGRPAVVIGQMLGACVLFAVLAFRFKNAEVVRTDLADIAAFCLISLVLNLYLNTVKARGCLSQMNAMDAKQELSLALSEAEARKRELSDSLDVANERLRIIQSLAGIYTSFYYVDVKHNLFLELGSRVDQIHDTIGQRGNASEKFSLMCTHLVSPECSGEMAEFTDIETLPRRLRGREFITRQFHSAVESRWIEGIFVPVDPDAEGYCSHVIWATRDIDEQKRQELAYQQALRQATQEARAANDAKSAFLFNMSHDIRTPMNAILGFAGLMEKKLDEPETLRVYLSKIRESGDYLLSIINNILDMARIESGKMELEPSCMDLEDFSSSVLDLLSEDIKRKKQGFTSALDVRHRYILADEGRMKQILVNLLSNAVKYTPAGGGIQLEIRELPCDQPDCASYRVTVADTGIGMSEAFQKRLFGTFEREHTSTESKVMGTGLGMSIVKKLVDLMGGRIAVESEAGKGTTFRVYLTFRLAEPPRKQETNAGFSMECLNFAGKRILLAEDNDLNAEIVMTILEEVGIRTERASDGEECLRMLLSAPGGYYAMILMDIQMPKLNGYQTTRRIRSLRDPRKADIPIVAMTANAFDEDRKAAREAGMNDHLAKPIDIPRLMETLATYLGRKRGEE